MISNRNRKTVSQSNRRTAPIPTPNVEVQGEFLQGAEELLLQNSPFGIGEPSPKTILALGADIKNRFLLVKRDALYCGPDIGDLSRAENFELFKKEIVKAVKKSKPRIIAHDLHPNYLSSLFAKELSLLTSRYSLFPVQHHHAHIASVMQEHNLKRPVLGVAFDGTGYGEDGRFWGGEFLLVGNSGFKRLAHFKYRMMPGADRVVYEPWRMALSILGEQAQPFLRSIKRKEQELILKMLAKDINAPLSSSAGRLFDACAALLGISLYASYEAEGPIKLEAMCEPGFSGSYGFDVTKEDGCFIVDTDGIFSGMLKDLKRNEPKGTIAARFHNSLAEIIVAMAKRLCPMYDIKDIALSGGVFQNKFLKTTAIRQLTDFGFKVFTNIKTPVNDLNISLGQYYISRYASVK